MRIILFLFPYILFSCVSAPKAIESTKPAVLLQDEVIDIIGLQQFLKLNSTRLGFSEKAFNTCEVGYGYVQNENCRKKMMMVIRFQIMCRPNLKNSNQILSQSDLIPLADQRLTWKLNNLSGASETNHYGYGQIITISSQSQKNQRLKITSGNDFLMMKSHEIDQVVTPPDWCK